MQASCLRSQPVYRAVCREGQGDLDSNAGLDDVAGAKENGV